MFRYIAFTWDRARPDSAATAERLEMALRDRVGWVPAFKMSGHHVYMVGNARGINDAYLLCPNQGVILGRLFRRGTPQPAGRGDVELSESEVARIVHSDGRTLIDQFWGRYVAFLPSWTGEARVLRDPTGTLPCYRIEVGGITIVLSWLEDLFTLLDVPMPPVDWTAVTSHMLLSHVSGPQTLLAGVTQVLGGQLKSITTGRTLPLWSAADKARQPSPVDDAEASRLLREVVAECAKGWASCFDSIVLRLSGGVDSSILLANLSTNEDGPRLVCLNYYASATDSDERSYARLAAQQHGVTLIERQPDDEIRLESILDVARTPQPAAYLGSIGTARIDAEVATQHAAEAVFNGAGGDQLFLEQRCTWPAADYLKLRGLDRQFPSTVLDSAHLGNVSFWKALRQALDARSFRGDPTQDAGRYLTLMCSDAMEAARQTAHRFVHPDWLAARDLPIGKFHQLGMLITPFEFYNHHLRDAAAPRVQPLMSQPLLELCLALPTFVLTRGGRGRALARASFAHQLPSEIATRRSKGGMESYIVSILQRNLGFAREMLLDGHLVKRGLLDRQRVEAALTGGPKSKTGYISEIHACLATEAWLQRVTSSAGRPA